LRDGCDASAQPPPSKRAPFTVTVCAPGHQASVLSGPVAAMVLSATTIFPAEAENMIGETELDVVVIVGDATVCLACAIPHHHQGES
jgi:hypothetical protein